MQQCKSWRCIIGAVLAAVGWLTANAGAIAGVASAGAAVYSAVKAPDYEAPEPIAPAQLMGGSGGGTTIDKTQAEQAKALDAAQIGEDSKKKKRAKAKTKYKVERAATQEETSTGVNIGKAPTGVQI